MAAPGIGEKVSVGRAGREDEAPRLMVVVGHDTAGNPVVEAIRDEPETEAVRRRVAPRMAQLSSVGMELGV